MDLEEIERILLNHPTTISDNSSSSLEDEHINNWYNYCNNISSQVNTMWNFILYNQFTNDEIRRLHDKVNFLETENRRINTNYTNSVLDGDELRYNNRKLKRKLEKYEEPETVSKKKFKKNDLLETELKLQTEYETISSDKKEEEVKKIFKSLNNIQDIINLKNFKYKYNYLDNTKFKKLYNLIDVLSELNDIIGMEDVKKNIFDTICYFLYNFNNKKELNHVMITGPPGVGKTTLAKLIGKVYLQLDFLENDTFVTARRSDLIAKYLGQTAIKTQDVIDKALGGVLFIDEVYSLGNPDKRDSFAKECIDTINLNMTEAPKPWLLIIGGYKEDIEDSFLSYNKGLERRFTVRMNLKGYSAEELFKILLKFIKDDGWQLQKDCINIEDIEKNISCFKYFAGDMQKVFQKAKHYYSVRLMQDSIDLNTDEKILLRDDIINSIEDLKSNLPKKDELEKTIQHSMYL